MQNVLDVKASSADKTDKDLHRQIFWEISRCHSTSPANWGTQQMAHSKEYKALVSTELWLSSMRIPTNAVFNDIRTIRRCTCVYIPRCSVHPVLNQILHPVIDWQRPSELSWKTLLPCSQAGVHVHWHSTHTYIAMSVYNISIYYKPQAFQSTCTYVCMVYSVTNYIIYSVAGATEVFNFITCV